jgi:hypothetical protein
MSPKSDTADPRPPDRFDPVRRADNSFDELFVTEWGLVPAGLEAADGAAPPVTTLSSTAYLGVE